MDDEQTGEFQELLKRLNKRALEAIAKVANDALV